MASLLNNDITKQIQDVFAQLHEPVQVLFFEQKENCDYCKDTRQLLEEVTALSDKLALNIYDLDQDRVLAGQYHVDKAPTFVIAGQDGDQITDYGIRFAGIPSGHEFSALIHDLVLVSGRDSQLNDKTRQFLKDLDRPVYLQVFTTPT